jgi:hypothetical protein
MSEVTISPDSQEQVDPRTKSIEFFFVSHDDNDKDLLTPWKQGLENMLQRTTGKVVAFIEAPDMTPDMSRVVTGAVEKGVLPSTALLTAAGAPEQEAASLFANAPEGFTKEQFSTLDKLAVQFPERLLVVPEAHDQDLGERVIELRNTVTHNRNLLLIAKKRQKAQLTDQYVEGAQAFGVVQRERDEGNITTIKNLMVRKDVTGCVGVMGANHTRIGHVLHRDGYSFKRTLTDHNPVSGHYLYSPADTLKRHFMFHPDVPASDRIKQAVSETSASSTMTQEEIRDSHQKIRSKSRPKSISRWLRQHAPFRK